MEMEMIKDRENKTNETKDRKPNGELITQEEISELAEKFKYYVECENILAQLSGTEFKLSIHRDRIAYRRTVKRWLREGHDVSQISNSKYDQDYLEALKKAEKWAEWERNESIEAWKQKIRENKPKFTAWGQKINELAGENWNNNSNYRDALNALYPENVHAGIPEPGVLLLPAHTKPNKKDISTGEWIDWTRKLEKWQTMTRAEMFQMELDERKAAQEKRRQKRVENQKKRRESRQKKFPETWTVINLESGKEVELQMGADMIHWHQYEDKPDKPIKSREDFMKRSYEWWAWIKENNRQWLLNMLIPWLEKVENITGRPVYLNGKPLTRERLERMPQGKYAVERGGPTGLHRVWAVLLTRPRSPKEQKTIRESMDNLEEYQEALDLEDLKEADQEDLELLDELTDFEYTPEKLEEIARTDLETESFKFWKRTGMELKITPTDVEARVRQIKIELGLLDDATMDEAWKNLWNLGYGTKGIRELDKDSLNRLKEEYSQEWENEQPVINLIIVEQTDRLIGSKKGVKGFGGIDKGQKIMPGKCCRTCRFLGEESVCKIHKCKTHPSAYCRRWDLNCDTKLWSGVINKMVDTQGLNTDR